MSMNPLTKCYKYNQCYFTHSIIGLIQAYKEYIYNLNDTNVTLWADFQRGAHHSRISLAGNIVDDLKDILETLDPELVYTGAEFVII